jgi:hypothetical protein
MLDQAADHLLGQVESGANRVPVGSDSISGLRPECRRMLDAAGFTYNDHVMAWTNRDAGRALAFDAVQQSADTLAVLLAQKYQPDRKAAWSHHLKSPPGAAEPWPLRPVLILRLRRCHISSVSRALVRSRRMRVEAEQGESEPDDRDDDRRPRQQLPLDLIHRARLAA